jgi:3-deoxy-D-manno-octulosonic-acid transferase
VATALRCYETAWRALLPLLQRHDRVARDFTARLAAELPPAEIWLHAASAGECRLAVQILATLRPRRALRALVTTNTTQGLELARRGLAATTHAAPPMHAQAALMPFDRPAVMREAVQRVRPELMVLLETELWPGLLAALNANRTPVLLLNARMTPRSLRRYRLTPALWRALRPTAVAAVSRDDAGRFKTLFGARDIAVMPNIKFDLLDEICPPEAVGATASILGNIAPVMVLGSIRREEEAAVAQLLTAVRAQQPQVVTALFPRHLERIPAWRQRLDRLNVTWRLRSDATGPAAAGEVILWDRFGELSAAYHLAHAALVGGSLAPLGGQNFMEALLGGTRPVIGPHWKNFHWVGREPIQAGLVREVATWRQAAAELLEMMARPVARRDIQAQARTYLARRSGGTRQACAAIARHRPELFFH